MAQLRTYTKKSVVSEDWIQSLVALGSWLESDDEWWLSCKDTATARNPWFTAEAIDRAAEAIMRHYLNAPALKDWLAQYATRAHNAQAHAVGLVLAGNIPLVGWHDLICVVLSGHHAVVKCSERDDVLIPALVEVWCRYKPEVQDRVSFVQKLGKVDAVLATGSNHTYSYFKQYFGHIPHIIRRNRNALAILDGAEDTSVLEALAADIFSYYGLGCRSVSHVLVPRGYNFEGLISATHKYVAVTNHTKYRNNYDFQLASRIINRLPYMASDCLILVESSHLASPVGVLHYSYYDDPKHLHQLVEGFGNGIQCIVGDTRLVSAAVCPGSAQHPSLWDYADGVDTMRFLVSLGAADGHTEIREEQLSN